jgi:hypothetical protein
MGLMVFGLNSWRDERFSGVLKSPDLLWGLLSHLFENNVVFSRGKNDRGMK